MIAEAVLHRFLGIALVGQADIHARVQKRLLAQTRLQRLEIKHRALAEDLRVRLEAHAGTGAVRGAFFHQLGDGVAALELLVIRRALVVDLDLQPLGKRVHDGRAHAVQAAGNLIAAAAELAARVQDREHDRHRRKARLVLDAHRDAAPVIRDAHNVPRQDLHVDPVAEARERLVDRVVHDLIDEVMQALRPRRRDIHAGPLAHSLQSLQNLDLVFIIILACLGDFV